MLTVDADADDSAMISVYAIWVRLLTIRARESKYIVFPTILKCTPSGVLNQVSGFYFFLLPLYK